MFVRNLARFGGALTLLLALPAAAQVSITTLGTPVTENFDTLAASGTGHTAVPAGWAFLETGTNNNGQYITGNGSGTAGDTYSFGTGTATDRAFGGIQSGNLIPTIGAAFTNSSGSTITSLAIAYAGEQWRLGTAARTDRLDFQFSTDATSLATGTWTDINELDFSTIDSATPTGARDGNAAAFRASITHTITGLTIANGATVWIRWNDFGASGADDGLAVDDFSLTATGAGPVLPNLSIDDVTQVEGNGGTSTFTFTVSLSAPAGAGGVTFDIATADGTATTADNDYLSSSLTAQSIASGQSSATFNVTVNGDATFEGDETFFVNVTNVTGATVADGQGLGTITNDDAAVVPVVSIVGNDTTEGDGGSVNLTFAVSLSSAAATDVTFTVDTVDGTATVANNDYTAIVATPVTIAAGQLGATVSVPVVGDTAVEADEVFTVRLSALSANATFPGGTATTEATGGILNDDVGLTLVAPAPAAEGDSGTSTRNFVVTLTSALASDLVFTASTQDGTATGGNASPADFQSFTNQAFAIPAGTLTLNVPATVFGDIADEADESFAIAIATTDPRIDQVSGPASTTITDDDDAPVEIHAIQGNGLRSPFAPPTGNASGAFVTTVDNVVTAVGPQGFFIQTPDARADADPLSSQGVYVFTSTAPAATIAVGDIVTVKGRAIEFNNLTEIGAPLTIIESGAGAALPTAIVFDDTRPSPNPATPSCSATLGNFECYEGQLVTVPSGVLIAGNLFFSSDPFAEVYATAQAERPRREEGLRPGLTPAGPTIPLWDGNPETFEIDADRLIAANANRAFIGGSAFSATGVIGYDFGNHELWPTSLTVADETVPNPVPVAGATQMTIGSFNVLRLCETVACATPAPTQPQIDLKIERIADYVVNVMRTPDVLGVQEVETIDLLQDLAAAVSLKSGATYAAFLAEGNDPGGIDVGFLVRTDRITGATVRQLGLAETITDCSGSPAPPTCPKHDRPPYLLQGTYTANGASFPFAVMNNHIRSRNDLETGSSTARVKAKRFAQAESIATYIQRFQLGQELDPSAPTGNTGTANTPLFLVGDYNAFEVTDGLVDVVALIAGTYDNTKNELQLPANITVPPLQNAAFAVPVENRYSYAFEENFGNMAGEEPDRSQQLQILDHGLYNHIAAPYFKAAAYGNTNVDAPKALNTTGLTGLGVSDHDGLVMYVETGSEIFANSFE